MQQRVRKPLRVAHRQPFGGDLRRGNRLLSRRQREQRPRMPHVELVGQHQCLNRLRELREPE